jgi:hypothetical protein
MVMERRRAAKGLRPLSLRDKEPELPYRGNSRLLAVLSLLPAEEMVRTRLGGHIEHAIAYVGTALLLGLSYPAWDWKRIAAALVIYAGSLTFCRIFRQVAIQQCWTGSQVLPAALIGITLMRVGMRFGDGGGLEFATDRVLQHGIQSTPLVRPLAPVIPASSYTATTCQPCRSATASGSLRWFCVVCPSVLTRR